MIRRYSQKGLEKRKEEREYLPEFFQKHIEIAKTKHCEECGAKLKGDVSEIAHVLPKQYFKSIMCSDENVLYLCGRHSDKQCHSNFDTWTDEKIKEMNIFPLVEEKYLNLILILTEKLNWKVNDRYTK